MLIAIFLSAVIGLMIGRISRGMYMALGLMTMGVLVLCAIVSAMAGLEFDSLNSSIFAGMISGAVCFFFARREKKTGSPCGCA
jgi:hypothetical protein